MTVRSNRLIALGHEGFDNIEVQQGKFANLDDIALSTIDEERFLDYSIEVQPLNETSVWWFTWVAAHDGELHERLRFKPDASVAPGMYAFNITFADNDDESNIFADTVSVNVTEAPRAQFNFTSQVRSNLTLEQGELMKYTLPRVRKNCRPYDVSLLNATSDDLPSFARIEQ